MLNRPVCTTAPLDERNAWPGGKFVAWLAWLAPATYFLFEFLVRVLPSVVEADLQADMHASGASIGFNMGLYYLAYAPMQLVVGVLLDRFGGRLPIACSAIVLGLGCALFAVAQSIGWLGASRALMGLGSAFAYIGTIYVASAWFPARRIAFIAGVTAALGMIGAIAGQIVAGVVLEAMPWRSAMWILAGVGIGLAAFVWVLVPTRPQYLTDRIRKEHKAQGGGVLTGLKSVLGMPSNWMLAAAVALMYLPIGVFGSMWGDRYLEHALNLSPQVAQGADAMLFVGVAISAPLLGWWTDRNGKRLLGMRVSAFASMAALLLQFYWVTEATAMWSFPLLFLLGLGSGGLILGFAMAIDQNGSHARGAALAFVNCAQMGVVFAGQWLVGVLFDAFAGTEAIAVYTRFDCQQAFAILPISVAIAAVLLFVLRHKPCLGNDEVKPDVMH
jgi:MFS family permease